MAFGGYRVYQAQAATNDSVSAPVKTQTAEDVSGEILPPKDTEPDAPADITRDDLTEPMVE